MTKLNRILAVALGLQLALAAGIFWLQRPVSAEQGQPLLALTPEQLDRVLIEAADGQTVTLVRQDGGWRLPDYHGLPADSDKLESLLQRLTKLRSDWPVATSAASRARFEVADDQFQRKLTLYQGDAAQATLYLGTSPAFRKVHLRVAEQDAIHAVELNTYDAPATADSWLDKELLRPAGTLSHLSGPDFQLQRAEQRWRLAGEPEAALHSEALETLTEALKNLRVQEVAQSAGSQDTPASYQLQVETDEGRWSYRFYQTEDTYWVQRDDYPQTFKIAPSTYERLTGQTRAQLVQASAETAELAESPQLEAGAVQ